MILCLKEQKRIINESSVNIWFKMSRTDFQPNIFKMVHKDNALLCLIVRMGAQTANFGKKPLKFIYIIIIREYII